MGLGLGVLELVEERESDAIEGGRVGGLSVQDERIVVARSLGVALCPIGVGQVDAD